MNILNNPVARKRFLRFKSMRRAHVSLWIIGVLYALSLSSELVCNNVPLLVRYDGRFYFPLVSYVSEDVFTGNGRQTRPDYKALEASDTFRASGKNDMIFPLFSCGPFESVDPKTIAVPDLVTLTLTPEPAMGEIDIQPDFTIMRARDAEWIAGNGLADADIDNDIDIDMSGQKLSAFLTPPKALAEAIAARFRNQDAPYSEFLAPGANGQKVMVLVSTFRKRQETPATIRLMLREMPANENASGKTVIVFNRNLSPEGGTATFWDQIPEDQARFLLSFITDRFDSPVDDYPLTIHGRQYTASFAKEEVRFPYPPVQGHPMGIDGAGRDVLARILYGFRISLTFGLLLVACSMGIGVMAGAVQGFYAGKLDITAQRLIEIWSALPFLYIMILMGSIYGRSFFLLLVCYGVFNWVGISYYIRAEFLNLRKRPFVEAARCMGVPSFKIIYRHILPNALVPVITFFPFSLVGAIGSLAALDYLGFGLPPPTPSWGELLFQAQQYRWAWWLILYPSLALFMVMLLGVFVGEGIRNAYDPKQYQRFQ